VAQRLARHRSHDRGDRHRSVLQHLLVRLLVLLTVLRELDLVDLDLVP
jgi:hypothetical protein